MSWAPHVVVAAVIEQEGRFLLVDEMSDGRRVYNQPAGHLDEGETLIEAVIRETLEETGWRFTPTELLGLYRWTNTKSGTTYLRVCFTGTVHDHDPHLPLDKDILETVWLTREEIESRRERWRSPLVMHCIQDYLEGTRYPLEFYRDFGDRLP